MRSPISISQLALALGLLATYKLQDVFATRMRALVVASKRLWKSPQSIDLEAYSLKKDHSSLAGQPSSKV